MIASWLAGLEAEQAQQLFPLALVAFDSFRLYRLSGLIIWLHMNLHSIAVLSMGDAQASGLPTGLCQQ